MISKHIHCKASNDNYKRLADYIAAAKHSRKQEKCLFSWCAGCIDDADYESSITEIELTQSLNTRSEKEKSYHLIVSFRKEDEGKLTKEDFKNIEQEFAKALGFEEHQRHCGVHINTDNIHMHIAYNMIHPQKHTRHEPYRDYKVRDEVCRKIEKQYNLAIDNGIDKDYLSVKLNDTSARVEAQTGEESFERYCHNQHDDIMELIEKAKNWQDVHKTFALFGLHLKQSGNGLAIKNAKGKQVIKASSLDRKLSLASLSKQFGKFEQAKNIENILPTIWYKKKPAQQNPDIKELWQEFIKQNGQEEIQTIKEKFYKEKVKLITLGVNRKTKSELMKLTRSKELAEINAVRMKLSRNQTKNWLKFLQEKANNGDERALRVLQSKRPKINPYKDELWTAFIKDQQQAMHLARLDLKGKVLTPEQRNEELENIAADYAITEQNFKRYLKTEADNGNNKAMSLLKSEEKQEVPQVESTRERLWQAFEKDQAIAFKLAKEDLKGKILSAAQFIEEVQDLKNNYEANQENFIRYLRSELKNGNKEVSSILRFEQQDYKDKHLTSKYQQSLINRDIQIKAKQDILQSNSSHQVKKKLLDIQVMEQILKKPVDYKISRTGAIIYNTPKGKIIDEGKRIVFADSAKDLAAEYFSVKSGLQNITFKQNNGINKNIINTKSAQYIRKTQGLSR